MPEDINEVEFEFEFYTKVSDPQGNYREEAETRLRQLAEGQNDMIGASVTLEELVEGAQTPHLFRAKIVAYTRPNYIVGEEKAEYPGKALKDALSAVERQVRDKREKLRTPWKQP